MSMVPDPKEARLKDQVYRREFEACWFRLDDDDDDEDEGGDNHDADESLARRQHKAQQLRTLGALNFAQSISNSQSSSATCYLVKRDLDDYHKVTAGAARCSSTQNLYLADCLQLLQSHHPDTARRSAPPSLADWRTLLATQKPSTKQWFCDSVLNCKGEHLDCKAEELTSRQVDQLKATADKGRRDEEPKTNVAEQSREEVDKGDPYEHFLNESRRRRRDVAQQLSQVYIGGKENVVVAPQPTLDMQQLPPVVDAPQQPAAMKVYPVFAAVKRQTPKANVTETTTATKICPRSKWVDLADDSLSCSQRASQTKPKTTTINPTVPGVSKWQQYVAEDVVDVEPMDDCPPVSPLPHSVAKRQRSATEEPMDTGDAVALSATQSEPKATGFISAREQLLISDRARNERDMPAASSSNSNPTRKLLGARRIGMQKPFVSPVPSSPTTTTTSTNDKRAAGVAAAPPVAAAADDVDERLRHIDPQMVELIRSEIMHATTNAQRRPIGWDDIAGLHYAKTTIREAVVWPMLRPDIFTGLRRPPRGILLFGPPGTGKTLIGKCIAAQSKSTFFSISASTLASKWVGDGEKLVRALFAVAAVHQPAVIFIDEIDSLLCQRSDTEHESSRRLKTEFLVQLDGAATDADSDRILVVGATNRPHELDEAARRRLVKRLYIPLPDAPARVQLLQRLLQQERNDLSEADVAAVAARTDGFSGADIRVLCQEASMGPIRALSMDECVERIDVSAVRAVGAGDFEAALRRVRSSVSPADLAQYVRWDETYGSGTASASTAV